MRISSSLSVTSCSASVLLGSSHGVSSRIWCFLEICLQVEEFDNSYLNALRVQFLVISELAVWLLWWTSETSVPPYFFTLLVLQVGIFLDPDALPGLFRLMLGEIGLDWLSAIIGLVGTPVTLFSFFNTRLWPSTGAVEHSIIARKEGIMNCNIGLVLYHTHKQILLW